MGVPLSQLISELDENPHLAEQFSSITLHCFCEQEDFSGLDKLIEKISVLLEKYSANWNFISLGGGFLFEDLEGLEKAMSSLNKYKLEVAFEPGSGTVADCATLQTSVVDLFTSGDSQVVVLDTSVNHLPEAFEYDYQYPLSESVESGNYQYVLAGGTCLAGDLFGEYHFTKKLACGDNLNFTDCGAYALVKAHHFNGFALPSIYLKKNGHVTFFSSCQYQDFYKRFN